MNADVTRTADQPTIWLSAEIIPTTGARLAAAVINTTGSELSYGVSGTFERWAEGSWRSAGTWTTSLDHWGGFGLAGPRTGRVLVLSIGLIAGAGSAGPLEYFSVPELEAGRYRVGHQHVQDAMSVYGVFDVASKAPTQAPIENSSQLTARPALLGPAGGRVTLAGVPPQSPQTPEDVHRFHEAMAPVVSLQRWHGGAWVDLDVLPVRIPAWAGLGHEDEITVPRLDPGAYRLVRQNDQVGNLHRGLWVGPTPLNDQPG